ncbi:hypothetical protein T08_12160 [Trichinella sp. T8]|nr:hypothetical protein T08_12160 [Trichinella sp. T8]
MKEMHMLTNLVYDITKMQYSLNMFSKRIMRVVCSIEYNELFILHHAISSDAVTVQINYTCKS